MAPPSPEALAPADRALVEQALRESGATTSRPGFGIFNYFADLGEALRRLIEELIETVGDAVSPNVLFGVLGFLAALGGILLVFLLIRWWRGRGPRLASAAEPRSASGAPALAPGTDWEAELDARLARGEIRPALEALWWWLAERLAEGVGSRPEKPLGATAAEPSWTTRELVQWAGRRDLLRLVTPLDRFLYGPAEPAAEEIRALFATFRQAFGSLGAAPEQR